MKTLDSLFYEYWSASHAISYKKSERVSYCMKSMKEQIPNFLEKYFDGSNKQFMNYVYDKVF